VIDSLSRIPNLSQNLFCGGLGALFIVLYRLYEVLPDIQAVLNPPANPAKNRGPSVVLIFLFIGKVILLIGCAAFVSGLLVRPQESYGAIITGMTWTTVTKNLIGAKR